MARHARKVDDREQTLESADAAGARYAHDQLGGEYFLNWVFDQVLEASKLPPDQVHPLETKADAQKIARNMLQQLGWDTKKELEPHTILGLSGADDGGGARSKEVVKSFYEGFDRVLKSKESVDWLADELLTSNAAAHEGRVAEAPRREIEHELWLCQDCMIAEVNGDVSGLDDERAEEVQKGIEQLVEQVGPLSANFGDGEGELEFSRKRCDACGTTLAGGRYRFASFGKGGLREAPRKRARNAQCHNEGMRETGAIGIHSHPRETLAKVRAGEPIVHDYIAVDRNDRRVAGPFRSRSEAEQHVPAGGYVKFSSATRRKAPPPPSSYPMFREGYPSNVNFHDGERVRIRIIGPQGQLHDEPFWYTVTGTQSVEDVALQFAQTIQPGMFVSIKTQSMAWTFQKEKYGGQNAVRRVNKLPTARYRETDPKAQRRA